MQSTAPLDAGRRTRVMRMYTSLGVGGIEHQLLTLLPHLNTGRYRVSLCLLWHAGELARELRSRGIEVHVLPRLPGRLNPVGLARLGRLFHRTGTRIVHAHTRPIYVPATVAARLFRIPVVIGTVHSMNRVHGHVRIQQDRILARWRDATVAVSEGVRRNYCETVGVDPSRVSVIHNGVDLSRFAGPSPDRGEVLGPLGARADDLVIACVARLVSAKSHDVLFEAFAKVLARAPRATLLLLGDGELGPSLRAEAERLGIAPRVLFAGTRSDVPRILRASDVSVLASNREGFSNVVIESLAAGLPMVATDVGGNAEAIEEGRSGYLVPVGDAAALAERLATLLTDEPLRARMAAEARARAARFSLEEAVTATEALYDRLLRARGIEPPAAAKQHAGRDARRLHE